VSKQTSDRFEKIGGDYDEVENTSGGPWPGSQMQARPHTNTPPRPGQHVSHRVPVEINAETGQALDGSMATSLSVAASHLSIGREHVDRAHPWARPMLEHIFGLNLPRRDRA
jgi:hypothetical protein